MELQQENSELRKLNADLESQIVDLKLKLKADKNSASAVSIEQEMKLDIGRASKFFHIFMSLSVSAETLWLTNPDSYTILRSAMRKVNICMGSWLRYTTQFQGSI